MFFNFYFPLSGNVNQDVNWFFSKLTNNKKFNVEKKIIDTVNYGSQLSAIIDYLAIIAEKDNINSKEKLKLIEIKKLIDDIKSGMNK